MIIKAHVLKGSHTMDVTFENEFNDRTNVIECTDYTCYIALVDLFKAFVTFMMYGEKHENTKDVAPADRYSFDFGSSITIFESQQKFIAVRFTKDGADVVTQNGSMKTDNHGMTDLGGGVKGHFSALATLQYPEAFYFARDTIFLDKGNSDILIPKQLDRAYETLRVFLESCGLIGNGEDALLSEYLGCALGCMLISNTVIFDAYTDEVNGEENHIGENIDSLVSQLTEVIRDIRERTIDISDDDISIEFAKNFDVERYQPIYPRIAIVFPDIPKEDYVKHILISTKVVENVAKDLTSKVMSARSSKEVEEIMQNQDCIYPGANPQTPVSVIAMSFDQDGNPCLENKEKIIEFVSKLKKSLGLDECDELPPMPVAGAAQFETTGKAIPITEDRNQVLIDMLHEVGLNIYFVDETEPENE